jgi:membrane associated rhomboid family serine protease
MPVAFLLLDPEGSHEIETAAGRRRVVPVTPWVRRLLAANVAVFLLTMGFPQLPQALVLVPVLIPERPWTVVTYMFLHAGLWHLVFNMIALYFFGPRVEERLGERHFIALYGFSGLMAALVSLVFTPGAAIVGASGAIFGVMLAFARYWPRSLIYIWGVVPVQARWFVVGMTALSLWGGFGGLQPGLAHFAHLGGFLGGFLYLLWFDRRRGSAMRAFAGAGRVPRAESPDASLARWERIRLDELHPVNRQALEPLLQKVAAGGAASLTPEERVLLDRFSP